MQDPIVSEVRSVRERHAAQYNFDLRAIFLALKADEQNSTQRKISFAPKRIKLDPAEAKAASSMR